MRQGELINLEWESVHIDQRLLILDNQYFINKSRRVRSIPFNDIVHEVFNKRYKSIKSKMVFTYHNSPIKQDLIVHKFKKYLRTAELREELKFHSLRHTFATWLVQKGVSIYQVSQLLGHADVTTTQIYAHLDVQDLRYAVQELNT